MTRATASLPKSVYPRECLVGAARVLGARGAASLGAEGKRWRLVVEAAPGEDAAALLGELLNDALARLLRRERLRRWRAPAAAVAGRLLDKGFPAAHSDPLEQLEPQVRADRADDVSALLDRARRQA